MIFSVLYRLSVKFYTATKINGKEVIQRGTDVVTQLKKKLRTDTDMIDFRVTLLDTYSEFSYNLHSAA